MKSAKHSPLPPGEGQGEGPGVRARSRARKLTPTTRSTTRARTLRRQSTDAEHLLWRHLRSRRLAGLKFRRQVVVEPYIVDFLCLEAMLIVEADGGQHAEQVDYDDKRTARLQAVGYRVLRFWNPEVLKQTEVVLEEIWRVGVERITSPSPPAPLPGGEG